MELRGAEMGFKCRSGVFGDEMTPEVVTVTFDVVGFDDWGPNWKVFNGDAGFVRVLDLIVVLFVVVVGFVLVATGLLGEEDREED